jgi:hypothetical protein
MEEKIITVKVIRVRSDEIYLLDCYRMGKDPHMPWQKGYEAKQVLPNNRITNDFYLTVAYPSQPQYLEG